MRSSIAVISANLGNYDLPHEYAPQVLPPDVELRYHRVTDDSFPPRKGMTSRLQCGIPKMFAWRLWPDYSFYLWLDASCALTRPDQVAQWLETIGNAELLLFRHPERASIRAEYEFMKTRMRRPGETYLTSRYAGELLDEQYAMVAADESYIDNRLFASTAFMMRNTERVRQMMTIWFSLKAAFCLHDQLALPWLVARSGCSVRVIEQDYMRSTYLTFVRPSRRARKE